MQRKHVVEVLDDVPGVVLHHADTLVLYLSTMSVCPSFLSICKLDIYYFIKPSILYSLWLLYLLLLLLDYRTHASLQELRRRYTNLYIPSDFCENHATWIDVFPAHKPLALDNSCAFHVMHKEVEPSTPNETLLDPPDADFTYSAKVFYLMYSVKYCFTP